MFSFQGPGIRVQGPGMRVQSSGFRVQGSGFRVQGSGFRVQGSGFRVKGSGFRIESLGRMSLRRLGAGVAGVTSRPRANFRVRVNMFFFWNLTEKISTQMLYY